MTFSRLLVRSLLHYWRINVAVALAAAVGVAVLIGSLAIGDSVRGSLRSLELDRLGRIDQALTSETFFREELARSFPGAAAAITLDASAAHAQSGRRANRVEAIGVDESFWKLGESDASWWTGVGRFDAALNSALARELGAREGDDILVRVQKPSAIPRTTLLGRRDDTVATLRLRVARILPDEGL
ncbi:MAG: hypothetical protein NTW86_22260, partial [Candidatus Sumerlaeota bacterium]|nr:hypothetical protein [Candidatus Sumerlaeota bacterium]